MKTEEKLPGSCGHGFDTDNSIIARPGNQTGKRCLAGVLLIVLQTMLAACTTHYIAGYSSVEFSADGQHIAAGTSQSVVILNTDTYVTEQVLTMIPANGKKKKKKDTRYGNGDTLVFMGNERLASTGFGGLVSIWDVYTGELQATIAADNEARIGVSVAWSETSGLLTVGTRNGEIYVYELDGDDLFPLGKLRGHRSMVLDMVFGSRGRYMASTAQSESVLVWDMEAMKLFAQIKGSNGTIDLELVGDSNTLIAVGTDIKRWDFMTQEDAGKLRDPSMAGQQAMMTGTVLLYAYSLVSVGYAGPVPGGVSASCRRTIAVSPDGSLLVDLQPGPFKEKISVIDIENDKIIQQLESNNLSCDAAFSPDGQQLLIAANNTMYIYDTKTWRRTEIVTW